MYPNSYEDLRRTYQNRSDMREAFNPVLSPKGAGGSSGQFKVGDMMRMGGGLGLGMGGTGGNTVGNNNNRGNFGSKLKNSRVSAQNSANKFPQNQSPY